MNYGFLLAPMPSPLGQLYDTDTLATGGCLHSQYLPYAQGNGQFFIHPLGCSARPHRWG
ncbi:hypothetical protein [Rudanella lutea]|uniref:hypothetical protein n=1 Tax=Rudanella lutea TaxID=451374 RepID=UPI0012FB6FC2|nr:hypothetical protein [Rudanella lutea]